MNISGQSEGGDLFPGNFILLPNALFAIPLNLTLITAILHNPELRSKPRNVFLISVILSDLSAIAESLIEVGHIFFPMESDEASDHVCKVYMAISRIPEILILVTTLLSLMDRYLAITKPLWHRSKVTAFWAAFGVILTTIFAVFINKFVYIFQIVPLRCGVHSVERRIIGLNLGILVLFCLIWRMIIYFKTRRLLENRSVQVSTISSSIRGHPNSDNLNLNNLERQQVEPHSHVTAQQQLSDSNTGTTALRRNYPAIRHREMEMEAIKNLASGVTSLFILSCPVIVFLLGMNICRSVSTTQAVCSHYSWLSEYVKQCYQLYGIYHPILYLGWNKEFYHVLRNPLSQVATRFTMCFRASLARIDSFFF